MDKQVTVQAVAAAIRVTKGVSRSHLYPSSSRNIRSTGVYTQKNRNGQIVLDYWTGGYKHHAERMDTELAAVTETLQAKGFKVVTVMEPAWSGSAATVTKRYVEVA